jgi:HK97 family phage prohead protease
MNKINLIAQLKSVEGESDDIFEVIISSDSMDRHGEILMQNGFDFSKWMLNPVFLWAHDYSAMPVGKGLSVISTGNTTVVRGQWAPASANPQAGYLKSLWKGGFLSAVSVGFLELERNGNMITKMELLEVSFVPVPANQDALALVRTLSVEPNFVEADWMKLFVDGKSCYDITNKELNHDPKDKISMENIEQKDAEAEEMDGVMKALEALKEAVGEAMDESEEDIGPAIKDAMESAKEAIMKALALDDDSSKEEKEEMDAVMACLATLETDVMDAMGKEDKEDDMVAEAFTKCKGGMEAAMKDEDTPEDQGGTDGDEEGMEKEKEKAVIVEKAGASISRANRAVIKEAIKRVTTAHKLAKKAHGHMENAIGSLASLVEGYDEEDEEGAEEDKSSKASSKERSKLEVSREERRAIERKVSLLGSITQSIAETLNKLNQ